MVLLRPGRIIALVMLVGLGFGGWWLWSRIHRSGPPSEASALASVRKAARQLAGVPHEGVYRYDQGGSERIGIGPLTVGRALPARALLAVVPTDRGERELRFEFSEDHAESWTVRVAGNGWRGQRRSLRIGTVGYGKTIEGDAKPPVLLRPRRLKVGTTWESIYQISGIVFQRRSKVVRREKVAVAGATVPTFVIQSEETLTGALHGDESSTAWWAPTLGVDVRVEWHRNFDGSVVNIVSDTLRLANAAPLR
jgi:hypothetical protein